MIRNTIEPGLIKEFWYLSSIKRTVDFDFWSFFFQFKHLLHQKLSLHCLLKFEDYILYMDQYHDLKQLKKFEYIGKHSGIKFIYEDIIKQIFLPRYNIHKLRHSNNERYKSLLLLYQEVLKYYTLSHPDKVFLVDRCLHAAHNSGTIIPNFEQIKKEYDNELLQIHKKRID